MNSLYLFLFCICLSSCLPSVAIQRGEYWGKKLSETAATERCLIKYQWDDRELNDCLEGVKRSINSSE